MNLTKGLLTFLIISMFLLSSCEVYQTLYGESSLEGPKKEGQVVRVESTEGLLSEALYASSEPVKHDPYKLSENSLGPYKQGKSLGFTLEQWNSASGIGIYSVDNDKASLELSFKNLVPNSVYTVWCSRLTMPPDYAVQERPCGKEDGSENSFTTDSKGVGSFSLAMSPLEASTKDTASVVAVAYHSDGKTHENLPGDFGMNTHVQLFFMVPQTAAEQIKYEMPIKFTTHLAAGMPEQDVFVEKAVEEEEITGGAVSELTPENKTEEIPIEMPEKKEPRPAENQPQEEPIVITVEETDMISLSPQAEDPDEDSSLVFTFTSPLNEEGKWQTGYGDAGQYTITVTASDGELTTSRDVLLIVNKKEESPTIDSAKPIETGLRIDETQSIDFSIQASDFNSDALTYSWKVDGNEVASETSYSYQTDYDSAGTHTIKVDVADSVSSASKLWSVDVVNVNRPAVLEMISDMNVKETDKVVITALATDDDNDAITYSISDSRFDQEDNVFTWETNYNSAGTYEVTVHANDGQDDTSQTFTVTVENVDRPPVITDIIQR